MSVQLSCFFQWRSSNSFATVVSVFRHILNRDHKMRIAGHKFDQGPIQWILLGLVEKTDRRDPNSLVWICLFSNIEHNVFITIWDQHPCHPMTFRYLVNSLNARLKSFDHIAYHTHYKWLLIYIVSFSGEFNCILNITNSWSPKHGLEWLKPVTLAGSWT